MAERESLLLAVLAPGSVEAAVGRAQEAIFREHGLVSAIALPPLVPVAFLDGGARERGQGEDGGEDDPLPRGFLGRVERAVRAPYWFTVTGMAWEGGALFLALDSGGVWRALREACAAELARAEDSPRIARDGAGLFPAFEGFFLGCVEATRAQRQSIRVEAPEARFSSAILAVARIATPASGQHWWREICCTIEEEKPLRGKRA
ncbi:MAG: hypothetical protein NT005_15410 [Spirochaetes bacterium]|nr:hypothetical protein [Spirochaetota bacterium]